MNETYLQNAIAKAKELAAEAGEEFDIRLFIRGVSKRASQLANGYQRLVPMMPGDMTSYLDIALKEVAAGQVIIRRNGQADAAPAEESNEITSILN